MEVFMNGQNVPSDTGTYNVTLVVIQMLQPSKTSVGSKALSQKSQLELLSPKMWLPPALPHNMCWSNVVLPRFHQSCSRKLHPCTQFCTQSIFWWWLFLQVQTHFDTHFVRCDIPKKISCEIMPIDVILACTSSLHLKRTWVQSGYKFP